MKCISDWYTSLGNYTFPTVFVRLTDDEIKAIQDKTRSSKVVTKFVSKLDHAIGMLPGSTFMHADCCAPTDSDTFRKRSGAVTSGAIAWQILLESAKLQGAFESEKTERVGFHPYRRMDRYREFRVFVRDRKIAAMSQLYLDRYVPKLGKRQQHLWCSAKDFVSVICDFLPANDTVIDIYFTSRDDIIIIDMNEWGAPTDPLLLRSWDQQWDDSIGLKLVTKPVKLGGEVSVSF